MSSSIHSQSAHALSTSTMGIPYIVRFWILLPLYIPALICSLFVLYHFILNRTLRKTIHNHVITLLLVINFIIQLFDISWILNFYRLEYVSIQTPVLCLTWAFVDEVLFIATTHLFAWASIERHILIFHNQWLATKQRLIFIHWIPIAVIFLYCIFYGFIIVIFPPCQNIFDYTQLMCGNPFCYYDVRSVAMWDDIVDHMIPTVIIVVCSATLLVRVVYQKKLRRQQIRWRSYRKMTIQLISISVLYLILYIPEMLMDFLHVCGVPEEAGNSFVSYADFFSFYGNLLLPFVCAGSMPELRTKLRKLLPCLQRRKRTVAPQALRLSRRMRVGIQ